MKESFSDTFSKKMKESVYDNLFMSWQQYLYNGVSVCFPWHIIINAAL